MLTFSFRDISVCRIQYLITETCNIEQSVFALISFLVSTMLRALANANLMQLGRIHRLGSITLPK